MRRATTIGVAAATGFIAVIVFLIGRPTDIGEPTADALARAYQQALDDRDLPAVARLVHNPPGDSALDALLHPRGCPGDPPIVRAQTNRREGNLVLLDSPTTSCARLPISKHDGRWLIDAFADPFHQP